MLEGLNKTNISFKKEKQLYLKKEYPQQNVRSETARYLRWCEFQKAWEVVKISFSTQNG